MAKLRLKEDDIGLLLPVFQPIVRRVVQGLKNAGYDPCVRDTLRTPEEAARNAKLGVGTEKSMHLYGIAADVVCQEHLWDCHEHGCLFYETLGDLVKHEGCVWGGDWRRRDYPHFQGIPVAWQDQMRAIGSSADKLAARDTLARRYLGSRRPAR